MEDVLALVGTDPEGLVDAEEIHERRFRRRIAATLGIEGCYVAEVPGVGPAFMQYLFTARDNDRLRSTFGGAFPVLDADQAMVEYLYVVPEARHPGLAVSCVAQVAEEAGRAGAASVISFIDPTNRGAIFVSQMTGFRAFSVRRTRSRLLRKSYTFEPWPPDVSTSLVDLVSGRAVIS
jgi:GNAT superfamily N-acetyltransferase